MASSHSQAFQILSQYPHRNPLNGDQIRALCSALKSLNGILGDDNAIKTSVYCSILRLLKAHVTPFPINAPVTFSQVQAARLQLLAETLLSEDKSFPPQLVTAIREGLVSGFDPQTGQQIPSDHQRHQLTSQQLADRHQILEERKRLSERQADFSRARHACVNAMRVHERQQAGPDPDLFIPWEQRIFKVDGTHLAAAASSSAASSSGIDPYDELVQQRRMHAPLDIDTLMSERNRILKHRTQTVVNDITDMIQSHEYGTHPLSPHQSALLETRLRHVNLLGLQARMRQAVWEEHQMPEREGRRGNRGRARTLKQLQREFERVERARTRQIESEERDARRKRQAWMNAMVEHQNKFRGYHRDVVRRGMRALTKSVMKHHEDVARNTSRAEREAERARIQKLKEDDEEGYLELVRQTKNTRLLELLDQTDKYLKELGAVVREERAKSGVVEYENGREKQGSRINYYEIAHAIKEEVREQSALLVGGTLKEYQLQGIQWMVSLYNNRLNGILADEMGLGKTIQTLGLIAHLMEKKDNPGPYLIIVPLSTISNWEAEFARWAPVIRVIVFKGDTKTRRKLYEDVIEKKSFNVCLVTYEYVVRGKNLLKRVEWQHIIIDEGHRIKNHESRLSSVLHAHYRSRNRLLLTGTPLQNSLTELWALLNFLLPNVFKSAESFESWFAAPFAQMGVGNVANNDEQAQLTEEESLLIIRRLHQVLRPFLLRRLKSDVLRMGEQLPEKQEHNLMCEMSAWQKHMYLRILKSERVLFTDKHGRQRYDKLPNPAIQLRKCVNHPYLFFADHASKLVDSPQLWRSSGKFDMLDSMIMKLLRTGHRLLIFNQMTKVVDLQERLLRYRNIPFYRLDGTTSTDDRKKMVNDFNDETTGINVFLLTTRAGGLGVNLQTADTVIIFDSDWNPSMDQQAQDRAHRIGQRREVLVIRMLTAKSIEEIVLERASFKRGLEKKIIRAGMFDEQSKDSERQAMLRELLRVEGGSDDDHPEDSMQTDEEVNRLLARSEEEFEKFTEIDQERIREIAPRTRLLSEKEIPEWAVKVPKALLQKAKISNASNWTRDIDGVDLEILNEPKKRRAATTNVSYGVDQLSERQYIKLMERSEAGEVLSYDTVRAATQRRKRRKKDRIRKDDDDDADADRDDSSLRASDGVTSEDIAHKSEGLGSKSLKMGMKRYNDDASDGGDDDDSDGQSGGDDLVIDDDDDDDDDDDNEDDDDVDADITPFRRRDNYVASDKDDIESPRLDEDDSNSDSSDDSASETISPAIKTSRGRKRGVVGRPRGSRLVRKRLRHDTASASNSTPGGSVEPSSNAAKKLISPSAVHAAPSDSDSSEESVAPIRRSTTRKRSKASSAALRASPATMEDGSDLSGNEPSVIRPPKKLRSSAESRPSRIQRLDRTMSPKKNLQAQFNEKSPQRRTDPSPLQSGIINNPPALSTSKNNNQENVVSVSKSSTKKQTVLKDDSSQMRKSIPGSVAAGKGSLSTSSRVAVADNKKSEREKHPSLVSKLSTTFSSSKLDNDNSVVASPAVRTASPAKELKKTGLTSSPVNKGSSTLPRKNATPSLNLTSAPAPLPKLTSVPVGFPKLSSAPLVKKSSSSSSSLSSDPLKSHKPSEPNLLETPVPRKISGPRNMIDEAPLPVLGPLSGSGLKKGSSTLHASVSNVASGPHIFKSSASTPLPVLSSKPIPPSKPVSSPKIPLSSKPLSSSAKPPTTPKAPPPKTPPRIVLASSTAKSGGTSSKISPGKTSILSKSNALTSPRSAIASNSSVGSPSKPSNTSIPSSGGPTKSSSSQHYHHNVKPSDAPRPILSSIALISSKPVISSRLLSGTTSPTLSSTSKPLHASSSAKNTNLSVKPSTGTQRGRSSEKSAARANEDRSYTKPVVRADSIPELNGKVSASSVASPNKSKRHHSETKRLTTDNADSKRGFVNDAKRKSGGGGGSTDPHSSDSKRASDIKRLDSAGTSKSSGPRTPKKVSKAPEYEAEDGEIPEEGELSEPLDRDSSNNGGASSERRPPNGISPSSINAGASTSVLALSSGRTTGSRGPSSSPHSHAVRSSSNSGAAHSKNSSGSSIPASSPTSSGSRHPPPSSRNMNSHYPIPHRHPPPLHHSHHHLNHPPPQYSHPYHPYHHHPSTASSTTSASSVGAVRSMPPPPMSSSRPVSRPGTGVRSPIRATSASSSARSGPMPTRTGMNQDTANAMRNTSPSLPANSNPIIAMPCLPPPPPPSHSSHPHSHRGRPPQVPPGNTRTNSTYPLILPALTQCETKNNNTTGTNGSSGSSIYSGPSPPGGPSIYGPASSSRSSGSGANGNGNNTSGGGNGGGGKGGSRSNSNAESGADIGGMRQNLQPSYRGPYGTGRPHSTSSPAVSSQTQQQQQQQNSSAGSRGGRLTSKLSVSSSTPSSTTAIKSSTASSSGFGTASTKNKVPVGSSSSVAASADPTISSVGSSTRSKTKAGNSSSSGSSTKEITKPSTPTTTSGKIVDAGISGGVDSGNNNSNNGRKTIGSATSSSDKDKRPAAAPSNCKKDGIVMSGSKNNGNSSGGASLSSSASPNAVNKAVCPSSLKNNNKNMNVGSHNKSTSNVASSTKEKRVESAKEVMKKDNKKTTPPRKPVVSVKDVEDGEEGEIEEEGEIKEDN